MSRCGVETALNSCADLMEKVVHMYKQVIPICFSVPPPFPPVPLPFMPPFHAAAAPEADSETNESDRVERRPAEEDEEKREVVDDMPSQLGAEEVDGDGDVSMSDA